jgi:uncharacterized protein YjbJ (UPF0337 family)
LTDKFHYRGFVIRARTGHSLEGG